MTAKEMFEKLGYDCIEDDSGISYTKLQERFDGELIISTIRFLKRDYLFSKTKQYGLFGTTKFSYITLDELQAINKQVEQLGWNK